MGNLVPDFETVDLVRFLPVYLLLDTSGSMNAKAAIEELNLGVALLMRNIVEEGEMGRSIRLAVITFDSEARLARPLSEVSPRSTVPMFEAKGQTNLTGAMQLLEKTLLQDIAVAARLKEAAYRPAVFLFTDGRPTDAAGHELTDHSSWLRPLNALKQHREWAPRIYPYGFGAASPEALKLMISESTNRGKAISDAVLEARFQQTSGETVSESISRLFKELFNTVITGASSATTGTTDDKLGEVLDETYYGNSESNQTKQTIVDQYI